MIYSVLASTSIGMMVVSLVSLVFRSRKSQAFARLFESRAPATEAPFLLRLRVDRLVLDLLSKAGLDLSFLGRLLPYSARKQHTASLRERRQAKIQLPVLIELLALYSSSGQSIGKAIEALASRMTGGVFDHLPQTVREIRQGRSAADALSMALSRYQLEEGRLIVRAIARAETTGTPMGKTLKIHARFLRQRLRIEAEKRASLIPIKVSICTAFFLLPSALTVVIFPNFLVFAKAFL
jgi:Flp pilus assembly protein TadB